MKSLFSLICLLPAAAWAISGEYHWTICETSPGAVKRQLGATVAKSSRRTLYYLDTANRDLFRSGVILRLRAQGKDPVEVTVKLSTDPGKIPGEFKKDDDFKCEVDYHGTRSTVFCSLGSEKLDPSDLEDYLKGKLGAEELATKKQHRYLSALGVSVPWRQLKAYGPVDNLKWKLEASLADFDMELMTATSGSNLFELSLKEDPASPTKFQKLGGALKTKGIRLCPKQTGTTSWTLGLD